MAAESFTKVTTQGWGSRIIGSIKGILTGLILFLASFVVLWWNEGRAVKTAKGLEEGAANVSSINPQSVDATTDGKLVHMSGMVVTTDSLHDEEFSISTNALKLRRVVEMYQWKENKETKKEKKLGGSEETTTTYSYVKDWSSSLINSSNFERQEGHINPSDFPYKSGTVEASEVTMGAYKLPGFLVSQMNNYQPLPVIKVDTVRHKGAKLVSDKVYIGSGSSVSPQIGDVKVSFEVVNPGEYSLVAKQAGSTFERYNTAMGTTIALVESGISSAENMFEAAQSRNTVLTWLLRLGGFLLMFFGLTMIFRPFVVVADVLPFLGNILSFGVGLFGGVVSFVLSLITIAIAWIFYRPVLGIALLVIAIGVFVLVYMRGQKKKMEMKTVKKAAG